MGKRTNYRNLIQYNDNLTDNEYYSYYSYKNTSIDDDIIYNDIRIHIMYMFKKISSYNITHCHSNCFNVLNYLAFIIKQSISKNNTIALTYCESAKLSIAYKTHYGYVGYLDTSELNIQVGILSRFGLTEYIKNINILNNLNIIEYNKIFNETNIYYIDPDNYIYTFLEYNK